MKTTDTDAAVPGRFWANILRLASGSVVSQGMILLTIPILTRFYSPHDFGVGALFLSFLIFLAPLSSLNYYQAIILPRDDRDANRLGELSLWLSLLASALFFGAFYLLRDHLEISFKMPELVRYFWLFPVAIFLRSLYLVFTSFTSRNRQFGLQARARVCQTLAERVVSLTAGFLGHASSLMLVFSRLFGIVMETGILIIAFFRNYESGRQCSERSSEMRSLASEYREFPRYSSWAMFLANGSSQLPILLLPVLFSPEIGGLYALGNRLLQIPMQLLGQAIRNVYYKEVAERIHEGKENRSNFFTLRKNLVSAGMFPFLLLLFFGDFIFANLFGHEWARAGVFTGIIGYYLFFQFIAAPISSIFNAYKKQKHLVTISCLLFLNNGLSLLVGKYLASPEIGLIMMSVNGVLIYIYMNVLAERVVGAGHRDQFETYGKYLLLNLPFVAAFYGFLRMMPPPAFVVAGCLVLSVFYYGLLYRNRIRGLLQEHGAL